MNTISATAQLLPCPCCGYRAEIEQVPHDPETPNSGGYYVECKRAGCGITTRLAFACKDDPVPGLVESWNARTRSEKANMPVELFDGYAVYQALDPVQQSRTSGENVGDVLDALARLIRKNAAPQGQSSNLRPPQNDRQAGTGPAASAPLKDERADKQRDDVDYAIEFGEYLAKDAEALRDAVNEHIQALDNEEESNIERTGEQLSEAMKAARSGVYEFRKRAERAKASRVTNTRNDKAEALARQLIEWAEKPHLLEAGGPQEEDDAFTKNMRAIRENTITVCRALLARSSTANVRTEMELSMIAMLERVQTCLANREQTKPDGTVDYLLVEVRNCLKTVADASSASSGWQPIATAPHKNELVIVLTESGIVCAADQYCGHWNMPLSYQDEVPVAWMPRPPAPDRNAT